MLAAAYIILHAVFMKSQTKYLSHRLIFLHAGVTSCSMFFIPYLLARFVPLYYHTILPALLGSVCFFNNLPLGLIVSVSDQSGFLCSKKKISVSHIRSYNLNMVCVIYIDTVYITAVLCITF